MLNETVTSTTQSSLYSAGPQQRYQSPSRTHSTEHSTQQTTQHSAQHSAQQHTFEQSEMLGLQKAEMFGRQELLNNEHSAMFGLDASGGPKMKITKEVHRTVRKSGSQPVENRSRSVEYADMSTMSTMEQDMKQMLEGDMSSLMKQEHSSKQSSRQIKPSKTTIETPSSTVTFEKGAGGTQMRVIQHTETSYVGGQEVNRASNVVVDESGSRESLEVKNKSPVREYRPPTRAFDKGRFGVTSPPPEYEKIVSGKEVHYKEHVIQRTDSPQQQQSGHLETLVKKSVPGKSVSVTETRIESKRTVGGRSVEKTEHSTEELMKKEQTCTSEELRSIMKQPGEESPKVKKGITFAESVQGG